MKGREIWIALWEKLIDSYSKGNTNFSMKDLQALHLEVADFKYQTHTQWNYFKSSLFNGKFIYEKGGGILGINWDKVIDTFPEITKKVEKAIKKGKK